MTRQQKRITKIASLRAEIAQAERAHRPVSRLRRQLRDLMLTELRAEDRAPRRNVSHETILKRVFSFARQVFARAA